MKLYTFFRSSASYRVRIALNLKGLGCELRRAARFYESRAREPAGRGMSTMSKGRRITDE